MSDNKNYAQRVSGKAAPTPGQEAASAPAPTPARAAAPTAAQSAAPTSAQSAAPAETKSAANPSRPENRVHKCALVTGPKYETIIAADPVFGFKTKVSVRLHSTLTGHSMNPWMGFTISFPLGENQKANEASGFGVRSNSMSTTPIFLLVNNTLTYSQ